MNIGETIRRHGQKAIEIPLDNPQYEAFKRLVSVAKEYADHEAEEWQRLGGQQPDYHRDAIYALEDVQTGFEHYDVHRDKPLLIPGDAAVFLTRGRHMATMANMEFMRSVQARVLITYLREILGIPYGEVVDSY